MRLVSELKNLAEIGLEEMGPRTAQAGRLREMRDCYEFFEREFPGLVERYQTTVAAQE
jgi:hypothetical protein